ncbi:Uncharacterized conserved protein YbaA, DUF1428 family [Poseidonocella pacifica]|uniref:Uncharacterized conserved protein YbaA, DUF1428 family n=1 Tax=Poseidonocella pacifica TaxID=871651 RepID=A0A1I0XIQ2_9RHOB|nr:DUF1428 domain-containing protein [Poseidonocella pacifica]SFB00784.1 Uncharacterized conserved protein YbaA, DUF1428 family [Poseidonocella pacifica]
MPHVSGFLAPVPEEKKDAYIASAKKFWPLFKEYGAISMTECWEATVPDGEVTSFPLAVKREPNEKVVFSWILWPDEETAGKCWAAMETDSRFQESMDMPFDGKRMVWGGFNTIFEGT